VNVIRVRQLHDALEKLSAAIRQVEDAIAVMRENHDPLALHIFYSRGQYRTANDTKSGKRREVAARLSYDRACELGFCGTVFEWQRLIGAIARR
jgi:hypothetical protein